MASVRPRNWFKRLFARNAEKPSVSPYHAVSIHCTDSACQAAKDNLGKRYLSAEAPFLPLRDCDRPDQCNCRYKHYDDRRREQRRRADQGLADHSNPDREERRRQKDRRAQNDGDDSEPVSIQEGSYYEHVEDTVRTATIEAGEQDGVDPYNSGSFDKSKSWDSDSDQ